MPKFKMLKGQESNLPVEKTEGQAYICTDTHNMFVDVSADERIQTNAKESESASQLKSGEETAQLADICLKKDGYINSYDEEPSEPALVNADLFKGKQIDEFWKKEDLVDAATLNGHDDSYFATNERINNLNHTKTVRFVIGTSTNGWTEDDCDFLCDGVDDQIEIQAAIDSLPFWNPSSSTKHSFGGDIILLDGNYFLSDTIRVLSNVRLIGTSRQFQYYQSSNLGGSILNIETLTPINFETGSELNNITVINKRQEQTSDPMLNCYSYVKFQNCTFFGQERQYEDTSSLLSCISASSYTIIDNCQFYNCQVAISGMQNGIIKNCYFSCKTRTQNPLWRAVVYNIQSTKILNNTFDCDGIAIRSASDNIISNNKINTKVGPCIRTLYGDIITNNQLTVYLDRDPTIPINTLATTFEFERGATLNVVSDNLILVTDNSQNISPIIKTIYLSDLSTQNLIDNNILYPVDITDEGQNNFKNNNYIFSDE